MTFKFCTHLDGEGKELFFFLNNCLPGVLWLLVFCCFSSRCHLMALQCVIYFILFFDHTGLLFCCLSVS